jgi:hypothetical protein
VDCIVIQTGYARARGRPAARSALAAACPRAGMISINH